MRGFATAVAAAMAVLAVQALPGRTRAAASDGAPIAGAPGWLLSTTLPRLSYPICNARLDGEQVDVTLMLNKAGQLMLTGGHPDWASRAGNVTLQLVVDSDPPASVPALSVGPVIMARVADATLTDRIRHARTLEWTTPERRVRADVSGIGVALDAVTDCTAKLARP